MPSTPTSPWFVATVGLAGIIVGYAIAGGIGDILPSGAGTPVLPGAEANLPPPPVYDPATVDDDAVLGQADAPVTIIEFTDYQCPFCSRHYEQTFGAIKSAYIDTGKVKYVVRDFALSFHPHAQKASESTECADDQDAFWEMHSVIFSKQQEWSSVADAVPLFKQYAADLGLNAATFASCLDNGTYEEEVMKDMTDGQTAGVGGTPAFWVVGPDGTGELIEGAFPYATFQEAIERYLP